MFLDIDHFKEINDTLSHEAGDRLLQELAERLRGEMRASETLARLGGDEFGVLCDGTADDALALAERLHRVLQQHFVIHDFPLEVALSAGVAVAPEHGTDALPDQVAGFHGQLAGGGLARSEGLEPPTF